MGQYEVGYFDPKDAFFHVIETYAYNRDAREAVCYLNGGNNATSIHGHVRVTDSNGI